MIVSRGFSDNHYSILVVNLWCGRRRDGGGIVVQSLLEQRRPLFYSSAVNSGQWVVNSEQWTVDSKTNCPLTTDN
jgi:hypothetical protein